MDLPNNAPVEALQDYCTRTVALAEDVSAAALRFVAKGGSIDEATSRHIEESGLGVSVFLNEAENGFSPEFRRVSAGLHLAIAETYASMPPEAKAMVRDKTLIEAVTKRIHIYKSIQSIPLNEWFIKSPEFF